MASNAIQAASGELVLSYYENAYPDEGDFTLCYNLSDVRQRFQNALPAEFWVNLREILDGVIQNKEIKKEWNDVRVNGYCWSDRCCDGCCRGSCDAGCCNGCVTMNCCRFCCCPGSCHCCYGDCKGCLSFRDYYLGAVVMVVFGVFTLFSYPFINPFALIMIILGAIMIENHKASNELKYAWRETVVVSLDTNLQTLGARFNVSFSVQRKDFFGVVIQMQNGRAAQQAQQTVMLMVQPSTQQQQQVTAPQHQPQQVFVQQAAYNQVPVYNPGAAPNANMEGGHTLS